MGPSERSFGDPQLWIMREQGMKTFEELKAVLTQDLIELEKLTGIWSSTIENRHVKEQEIGRHYYEAEEDLSQTELNTEKGAWHQ